VRAHGFEHSHTEDRVTTIRPFLCGTIVVVFVERSEGEATRLISARLATSLEKKKYTEFVGEIVMSSEIGELTTGDFDRTISREQVLGTPTYRRKCFSGFWQNILVCFLTL
jgi:hypothetical protein